MFKPIKNKNYDENERSILINSLFTNEDYINIFNKYKNDEKLLFFLTRLIFFQIIQVIFHKTKIKT